MKKNNIIEEVRTAGKKLSEECNNDIHQFASYIKKKEEESRKRGWKVVSKSNIVSV